MAGGARRAAGDGDVVDGSLGLDRRVQTRIALAAQVAGRASRRDRSMFCRAKRGFEKRRRLQGASIPMAIAAFGITIDWNVPRDHARCRRSIVAGFTRSNPKENE
jgi:hypothetical protein